MAKEAKKEIVERAFKHLFCNVGDDDWPKDPMGALLNAAGKNCSGEEISSFCNGGRMVVWEPFVGYDARFLLDELNGLIADMSTPVNTTEMDVFFGGWAYIAVKPGNGAAKLLESEKKISTLKDIAAHIGINMDNTTVKSFPAKKAKEAEAPFGGWAYINAASCEEAEEKVSLLKDIAAHIGINMDNVTTRVPQK